MVSIHHEKKLCYFHIPKTAGSYIQKTLHLYYDFKNYNKLARYDLDEITFNSNFFKKKPNIINNQNFFATNPYSTKKIGIQKYYSTSPILLSIMNLNDNAWDNLFKFTFVRNPYTRFISSWNYVINGFKTKQIMNDKKYTLTDIEKYTDLKYTILNKELLNPIAYNHIFMTQYDHILDKNNNNNMDFIGKTENLETDLEIVLNNNNINQINHIKETCVNKTAHKDYKEYYTQDILDFVNNFFDIDFKEFGYNKIYDIDNLK